MKTPLRRALVWYVNAGDYVPIPMPHFRALSRAGLLETCAVDKECQKLNMYALVRLVLHEATDE